MAIEQATDHHFSLHSNFSSVYVFAFSLCLPLNVNLSSTKQKAY
jgi:hypothetical protein